MELRLILRIIRLVSFPLLQTTALRNANNQRAHDTFKALTHRRLIPQDLPRLQPPLVALSRLVTNNFTGTRIQRKTWTQKTHCFLLDPVSYQIETEPPFKFMACRTNADSVQVPTWGIVFNTGCTYYVSRQHTGSASTQDLLNSTLPAQRPSYCRTADI